MAVHWKKPKPGEIRKVERVDVLPVRFRKPAVKQVSPVTATVQA